MRRTRIGTVAVVVAATSVAAAGAVSAQSPSAPAGGAWTVGVVTDVGTLDDRNFNQYSWEGAELGATAIGATASSIVTQNSADYAKNIQTFVDQGTNVIVTVGFALGADTAAAAKANPDVFFIGVDQGVCIDENGDNDPNFACAGDPATLLPNYQGLVFAEAQPGYLAGIVAANVSKSQHIAVIGGASFIPAVANYANGYAAGAKSVNPDIKVEIQYVSDDLTKAFNDPAGGKAFAEQLLSLNPDVDVIFQAAGKTGNGVLQAACDAKAANPDVWAIGVDVDQFLSTPETAACTLTSAEKKLSNAVSQAVQAAAAGTSVGGSSLFNASNDGIGISPFHDHEAAVSAETVAAVDAAFQAMAAGTLDPLASPAP
jgi:basic membrane protein A